MANANLIRAFRRTGERTDGRNRQTEIDRDRQTERQRETDRQRERERNRERKHR